jgi:tRNA A37 N6-isopentenylltransferase MiaA
MEDRIRFIVHEDRRIVLLDFTDLTEEAETLRWIEAARDFFDHQVPEGKLLTLTDGTGARYTSAVMEALKQLAAHNKPYVRAGAAVTTSRLHRVVIAAVAVFTGRHLPVFPARAEALAWLARQ